MKNLRLLYVLLILPLAACSSMIANMATATPVPNYVYLHDKPRIGDHASYRSLDGTQLMRMEILAVPDPGAGNHYKVHVSWPFAAGWAAGFLREHAYYFHVTETGRVARAELLNIETGVIRPVPVAGPGQVGHIDTPAFTELEQPEAFNAAGTAYKIDAVLVHAGTQQDAAGITRVTSTSFIDRDIPFGLVRQINVAESEVRMLEVVSFINAISPTGAVVKRLLDFVVQRAKHQRIENGMDLVEYGRKT